MLLFYTRSVKCSFIGPVSDADDENGLHRTGPHHTQVSAVLCFGYRSWEVPSMLVMLLVDSFANQS
jgi:hypothetical protein